MIELDTTRAALTGMNLSKIEHAMNEVQEGVQHFLDRLALGDEQINYMAMERLRHSTRVAHAEFDAFKHHMTRGTQHTPPPAKLTIDHG